MSDLVRLEKELKVPCPECEFSGKLGIYRTLYAKPVGSFSLAGAQLKVSAYEVPILACGHCGLKLVGQYEMEHGKPYAVFNPEDIWEEGTDLDGE